MWNELIDATILKYAVMDLFDYVYICYFNRFRHYC